MKVKLGNFIEIFGIVLGVAGIVGCVILFIKNSLFFGIVSLVAGVCLFVFSLAISQMLFSISAIEEDTEMMSKRMAVLEDLNREAVEKDLFSANPRKSVNIAQKSAIPKKAPAPQPSAPKPQVQSSAGMGTCYKCGYKAEFTGGNFCPKCGNHSFYLE